MATSLEFARPEQAASGNALKTSPTSKRQLFALARIQPLAHWRVRHRVSAVLSAGWHYRE